MTTEAKTLHIRRATALDAVNIYRLIVDEEKRAGLDAGTPDGDRIADILGVISEGYASAAVISGRVVGTIGAVFRESPKPALVSAWYAVAPSFHDTPLAQALLNGLLAQSDTLGFPVFVTLPTPVPAHLREAVTASGFETKMWMGRREPQKSDGQEQKPTEEGSKIEDALA